MSNFYIQAMSLSKRATTKYSSYGPLYDLIFADIKSRNAVHILEIGVSSGGGLETWRRLFGPDATIVGLELNPGATELMVEGFEILVGDSQSDDVWKELAERYPQGFDLIVDDGGHTNAQQIETLIRGRQILKEAGWLVIEDLHASWMRNYGNPSSASTYRLLEELLERQQLNHFAVEKSRQTLNPGWVFDLIVSAPSIVAMRKPRADYVPDLRLDFGEIAAYATRDFRFESLPSFIDWFPGWSRRHVKKWVQRAISRRAYSRARRDFDSGKLSQVKSRTSS